MFSSPRATTADQANRRVGRGVRTVARADLMRCAAAVASIGVALALALEFRGMIDATGLFLVAVAIATWSGGWQAGLLAAGLATVTVDYFFTAPLYSVVVTPAELPRLFTFVLCALAVSWATDARRVAAEHALRNSQRQLAAVFDEAPVGIALIDATGHAFKTNRRLEDMFGYTAREFRRFPFTRVMHPPGADVDWNLFAEMIQGGRHSYQLEKRCVAKDGGVLWASMTVSLLRADRGEPTFGIVLVGDITNRKRAESQLGRIEDEVEGQRLSQAGSWRWHPADVGDRQ
jgi:PAS domain S-box-containing protein